MALAPLELVLYHDVLCAWSWLAEGRLRQLAQRWEFGSSIQLSRKAFPTRHRDTVPTARERRTLARHYARAGKTNDGRGIVSDLWLTSDPPLSSLPPLLAFHSARLQGEQRGEEFLAALRQAAFYRGINIARRDVLIEIADRLRLDLPQFLAGLDSPATETALYADHDEGEARGVGGVPALLLRPAASVPGSPEWLLTGCREIYEYRELITQFRHKLEGLNPERLLH